jgi:cell surface protein SprA
MMKNIYNLGVSSINPDGFNLAVEYTEGNVAQTTLPGRDSFLMQDLGLDRVDSQGSTDPDNQVDFGTGTLDPATGRVLFPYLQPFGNHIGFFQQILNAVAEWLPVE